MIVVNSRFLTQNITGVQRFAIEISRELKKLRKDLIFLSPPGIIHPEIADKIGARTTGALKGHLWEQIFLPLAIMRLGTPLLLNLANTGPILISKQVVTIHDLAVFRFPHSFSRVFSTYYRFLLPIISKKARAVITVSEFSKQEIVNILGVSESKVHVVHNAVSSNIICTPRKLEEKEDFILTVSSLDPRKNLVNLIRAFNSMRLKNYKLLIAGAESKVFSKINFDVDTTNVEFLGYQGDQELSKLYERAMLFVYPSIYEGFGIPPLEAMKCGTPVIVSREASLPEVCGDAAFYVDTDAESIRAGMEKLLTSPDLMNELIEKGFTRVRVFSWEKSARKLNSLLSQLIE